ncbi:hypothetical protein RA28_19475 [Ruegeria sp. ANG-S4]|nr:hypothetical protein RA28_19475 [Ruegeria sp. ANG-S4]
MYIEIAQWPVYCAAPKLIKNTEENLEYSRSTLLCEDKERFKCWNHIRNGSTDIDQMELPTLKMKLKKLYREKYFLAPLVI